jgi:hypothetical protein
MVMSASNMAPLGWPVKRPPSNARCAFRRLLAMAGRVSHGEGAGAADSCTGGDDRPVDRLQITREAAVPDDLEQWGGQQDR